MINRKPFQGVWNIIRFNWPFYVLSVGVAVLLVVARGYVSGVFATVIAALLLLVVVLTLVSLLASFYIYDQSGFYDLRWLDGISNRENERIANINAGFDETSSLLKERFANANLSVCDFYDPAVHTESSIKRARKAYPPFPGTRSVSTHTLPFEMNSLDKVFTIMSAHEIRRADERRDFFSEVNRVLSADGQAVVVEHLRDAANLLVYNFGAFHFYSRSAWLEIFKAAKLMVADEKKITPFLTAFFLRKNGTES